MTDAPTPRDEAIKSAMRAALTGLDGAIITRGMMADFHAALTAAGYVVVPRYPTKAMHTAGNWIWGESVDAIYRAMIEEWEKSAVDIPPAEAA